MRQVARCPDPGLDPSTTPHPAPPLAHGLAHGLASGLGSSAVGSSAVGARLGLTGSRQPRVLRLAASRASRGLLPLHATQHDARRTQDATASESQPPRPTPRARLSLPTTDYHYRLLGALPAIDVTYAGAYSWQRQSGIWKSRLVAGRGRGGQGAACTVSGARPRWGGVGGAAAGMGVQGVGSGGCGCRAACIKSKNKNNDSSVAQLLSVLPQLPLLLFAFAS